MIMEPAPQNPDEFEKLRNLLALKRHEEPPPGYFDRLPGEVRARIAHAQANPEPWWQRWLESWNLSPALATSYAAMTAALLLGGVWFVQRPAVPQGGPQVVTVPLTVPPSTDTNGTPTGAGTDANPTPSGLFNTPSLPVQPAEFKK